jgi:hypothetical protein
MELPENQLPKPEQQQSQVVVGADTSLRGSLSDLRNRLGLAERKLLWFGGVAAVVLVVACSAFLAWNKFIPVLSPDGNTGASKTQKSSMAHGNDTNEVLNLPTNQTPGQNSSQPGTTASKSTGGGTGASTGGSSSGGSTSGPCSGAANHVPGGPDGTGTCWPGPGNTGVPAGTVLTTYTGPCTITTANTVIDSKIINCSDGLGVLAANVTIKNSKVNTYIALDSDRPGGINFSLTVQDSEVNGNGTLQSALAAANLTLIRDNIYGGINGSECDPPMNYCTIRDTYIHGQTFVQGIDTHLGGFLSDGGTNLTLVHNTLFCDTPVNNVGGGCTGDMNFIPNFAAIDGALIEHNLFGASVDLSYCTYGGEKSSSPTPHSYNVVYKDNIFKRGSNGQCGGYGPVTGFNVNNSGNLWTNNRWEDGGVVDPEN